MTTPFHTVSNSRGMNIDGKIQRLSNCTKINLGVSDMNSTPQKNIFWMKDAYPEDGIEGHIGKSYSRVGFRTSVYSPNIINTQNGTSAMISLQIIPD